MATIRFDVNDPDLQGSFLGQLFLDALAALRDDTPPRWGKMTAQQMVEHLMWGFELSTGQAQVECPIPEERRVRMKGFLYHNRPSPHDFMNPALAGGLPPLRYARLAEAKAALRVEVDRFLDHLRANTGAVHTHPVFGPIGVEEW